MQSILLVDDNTLLLEALEKIFSLNKYNVIACAHGSMAQEALAKKAVDIIISDIMMPDISGYDLYNHARSLPSSAQIPFVFLTALDQIDNIRKGYLSGADAYVTKPFEPEFLLDLIRGKLARSEDVNRSKELEMERYRRQVISTLSHEFRTPLTAIAAAADILLTKKEMIDPEYSLSLIKSIARGGERLESLVNDFLALQKIAAGIADNVFHEKAKKFQVKNLVNTYHHRWHVEALSIDVPLIVRNSCETAEVFVYDNHFFDIMTRLVGNAVKFSPKGERVELCAVQSEDKIVLEVHDRGQGLAEREAQSALHAFTQIDREHKEQQGSGLGLAIASKYAEINRGKLVLFPRSGGGATAQLTLPCAS